MQRNKTLLTPRQKKWFRFNDRLCDYIGLFLLSPLGILFIPVTLPIVIVLGIIQSLIFKIGFRILRYFERNSVDYLIDYSETFKLQDEIRRFESERLAEDAGLTNLKT